MTIRGARPPALAAHVAAAVQAAVQHRPAPHVQSALAAAAGQAKLATSRPLASHVQAAIANAAQARLPQSRPAGHGGAPAIQPRPAAGRPLAPHFQAAIASAAQASLPQNRPADRHNALPVVACAVTVLQRMEEYPGWKPLGSNPLYHPPSPTASPLRESQEDIVESVRDEMVSYSEKAKKRSKPEKPQPKETVKGNIGELSAQKKYEAEGIPCLDANRVVQKNIAGIDHFINKGKFCFSQSKVHIANKTVEGIVEEYKGEIDGREGMALIFLQKVIKGNKFAALELVNTQLGDHPTLARIIKEIKKEDYEDPSDIDTSYDAVQWAADAILFPVPCDIYDRLPASYKARALRLDVDCDWYTSTLRKCCYMEKKTKLSGEKREEHEDPTFGE